MTDQDVDEVHLVQRLCNGDSAAFELLVSRHHVSMVRVARTFVSTDAAAEDVAQEAWLGALRGIGRFEGRSTLKTWLFRILVNRAKARGIREARCRPFSSSNSGKVYTIDLDPPDPDNQTAGRWLEPSSSSLHRRGPDIALIDAEIREDIKLALARLPKSQRSVVMLRDVSGFSAPEVCAMLGLTEANQRVLLHRGRTKMRSLLREHRSRTLARQVG